MENKEKTGKSLPNNLLLWIVIAVLAVAAIVGGMLLLRPAVQVTPTLMSGELVEPDTAFLIAKPGGMDEAELRAAISFTPPVSFALEKQENGDYILTPVRPLPAGEKVTLHFGGKDTQYQVAKTLLVTSFMPTDDSTGVPVGSGVEFQFNRANVPLGDFKSAVIISPAFGYEVTSGDGSFVLYPTQQMDYGIEYTVTLNTPLTTPDGFTLREAVTFTFTTITQVAEANDYLFTLSSSGATANMLSDETPQMMVYLDELATQKGIPEIAVKLYRYPDAQAYKAVVEKTFLSSNSGKGGRNGNTQLTTDGLTEYASFAAAPFQAAKNEGDGMSFQNNQYVLVFPEPLPPGQYAVEYSMVTPQTDADGSPYTIRRYQLLQSTDLSLFFMQTGDDLLLWVNDIITGQPVEGAQFDLGGNISATGSTGTDGTVLIRQEGMSVTDWRDNAGVFTLTAGDKVFVDGQIFNPYEDDKRTDYVSYLFTDRPIYRTTDTVQVWGMVRPRNTQTPAPKQVSLVMDGVPPVMVQPDANGLFTAKLSYADMNADYGGYLQLTLADPALEQKDQLIIREHYLRIEDYVKPIYTASGAPTRPIYLLGHGEPPTVNVDVSLFDGTPVPAFAAKVESWGGVDFTWPGNGGLRTDAQGRASFFMNIPEAGNTSKNTWYPRSYSYRFQSDAAEGENFYSYGDVYVVHRDVMVTGEAVRKGDLSEITLHTNKVDISKVKDSGDLWKKNILKGTPVAADVTAILQRTYNDKIYMGTTYDFINRQAMPRYRYQSVTVEEDRWSFKTQAGAYTLKDLPVSDEENTYSVKFIAQDSLARPVEYTVYLSPPSQDYWRDSGDLRYSLAKDIKPESLKAESDGYGYSYPDPWQLRSSFVDDEAVTFTLQCNERPVTEMKGRILSATVQKNFQNVTLTEKPTLTLPFSEELLPNYVITGAYFDGRHAFMLQDNYMTYDPKLRELAIELTGDKAVYAPADPVKINATVTEKATGKPAPNAEIVVSVVDESIFALQEQSLDLLGTIYASVYYPPISKYSSYTPPEYGGAGEKGGGGGEDVRSDFKDTAYFARGKTDANGKAQFSFPLPDNITSWRVSSLALTDNNRAGGEKINLSATKKFFVTPVVNGTLIEGDSFAVGLRGAGTGVTQTDEVTYTVEVTGPGYSETLEAAALLRDYATVAFVPPSVGDYTVTIRGRCKGNSDAVRLPFTVVSSGLELTLVKSFTLTEGIQVEPLRYPVRVELYNQSLRTYNRVLRNLMNNTSGVRSDMRIARKYIAQTMEAEGGYWYWDSESVDISDLTGALPVLPYEKPNIDYTAYLALAVPGMVQAENLAYMGPAELVGMDGAESSLELSKAVAQAANPGREFTDVGTIRGMLEKNPGYTLIEKLNLNTALALLGDTETASKSYETLVTPKLQKLTGLSGEEVLYTTGEGALSEKDCTAAAFRLASVLGHKDTEGLILYLIQQPSYYEPYIAEQLLFLERYQPREETAAKVSYTLDGKTVNETLDRHGISLTLTKEQLAAVNFKVVSGEAMADVYYTGGIAEHTDTAKRKLGITKTITPMEGEIAAGKLVKITLTPDLSGLNKDIGDCELVVDDYIPTGMRFERYGSENQQPNRANWWLSSRQGQRLRFTLWADGSAVPIVYYARCSTPGDYVVESAYIASASADTWGAGERGVVTIR